MISVTLRSTTVDNSYMATVLRHCWFEDFCLFFTETFSKLTYKSMRCFDVKDAFNVAGVDEMLVILLHHHSMLCCTTLSHWSARI